MIHYDEYVIARGDQELTKDLHFIGPFHHLFDHTHFALTDISFIRDFLTEITMEVVIGGGDAVPCFGAMVCYFCPNNKNNPDNERNETHYHPDRL